MWKEEHWILYRTSVTGFRILICFLKFILQAAIITCSNTLYSLLCDVGQVLNLLSFLRSSTIRHVALLDAVTGSCCYFRCLSRLLRQLLLLILSRSVASRNLIIFFGYGAPIDHLQVLLLLLSVVVLCSKYGLSVFLLVCRLKGFTCGL